MSFALTRFLHLSDLHFGKDHQFARSDGPTATTLLEAMRSDVVSAGVVDAVVVSGDLTSTGRKDEFREAEAFLIGLCKMCDIDRARVLFVPGNHDVLWTRGDDVSKAEYLSFASRFTRVPTSDLEGPRLVQAKGVAILGIDSIRASKASAGGLGLVGTDQLREAEALIGSVGPEAMRVLVLHHHLIPVEWKVTDPEGMPSVTVDARGVLAWAQRMGFRCILHGHQHQGMWASYQDGEVSGGPVLLAAAPSAAARDLPPQVSNGYQWIEVDGRSLRVSRRVAHASHAAFNVERSTELVCEAPGVFFASSIPTTRAGREPSTLEIRSVFSAACVRTRDALTSSFGPSGGYRSVARAGTPSHVRDGTQILRSTTGGDPVENRVYRVGNELMSEMGKAHGDGRKTAGIIWSEVVRLGIEAISAGADARDVVAGLAAGSLDAVAFIRRRATKVIGPSEVSAVATAAAGGRMDVGQAVCKAFEQAGSSGTIEIDAGLINTDAKFHVRSAEAIWECGTHPDWVTRQFVDGALDAANALVCIYDGVVETTEDIIVPLEYAASEGRSLVLLARKFEPVVLETARLNAVGGTALALPLSMSRPSGHFEDASVVSGARVLRKESGQVLRGARRCDLGAVASATVTERGLSMEPVQGPEFLKRLTEHLELLRTHRGRVQSPYDDWILSQRAARVCGGAVRIVVDSASEAEGVLLRGLLGDALLATRSAVESGTVAGGGIILSEVADGLMSGPVGDGLWQGRQVLAGALRRPKAVLNPAIEVLDSAGIVASAVRLAVESASRMLLTQSLDISFVEEQ